MTRKICVFTGTRAEYGLLAPLLRKIQADPILRLQLLVSGTHLAHEFGETYRQIEADGFAIDEKVDMQLADDSPVGISKSMALALSGCGEALDRLRPDLLVLLGDRYEALAVAQAALLQRIPVAHIHGGETTEGAIDDAIRHAITKMSHLHFAATDAYRNRIIQLGEQPDRVFAVGAPGLDQVAQLVPLERRELEKQLGFRFRDQNVLVTYHPATLDETPPAVAAQQLFDALDTFDSLGMILTKSNADVGGREINAMIDTYASANPGRIFAAASLGQQRYLSAMALVNAVVGNSSSGIIEAPAMGKPTVNIGTRQQGRARAPSVIDCAEDTSAIVAALTRVLSPAMQALAARRESPYGAGGGVSDRIKTILAGVELERLCHKRFYDIGVATR